LKTQTKTQSNIDLTAHSELLLQRNRNENKPRLGADFLPV
jgi:hypothetical protein